MKTKVCPDCRRELLLGKFSKNRSNKDKLSCYCRGCDSRHRKENYYKNRDRYLRYQREYQKKYYNTIVGYLRYVFGGINRRCNSPGCSNYRNYGGRGIQNKFKSSDEFVNYVIDGLKVDPRGLQIDRIDNGGHYEKGNIRFVTRKENNNNRRNNKKFERAVIC